MPNQDVSKVVQVAFPDVIVIVLISFLVEITDVCEIKNTLYRLLADFHQEKLHAFGESALGVISNRILRIIAGDGITFENMIKVREQQENLARLHFELNLQQTA